MSPDTPKQIVGWGAPNQPMFVTGRDNTFFYIKGPRFYGYVVPDIRRECALRDAVARFQKLQTQFGYILGPVVIGSVLSLDGPYGLFALAVLNIGLIIAALGTSLIRQQCFTELVDGLDTVKPLDIAARRRGFLLFTLLAFAYCLFVIFRVLRELHSNPF